MKSKLEPVNAFVYRLGPGASVLWSYNAVCRAIRERDRQWERMLAELYKERKKERNHGRSR